MGSIENNIVLLSVIFLMLLGAFIIGYLFGNFKSKEDKEALSQSNTIKPKSKIKPQTNSHSTTDITESGRLEIADITEPGKVRAMKTRERAGVMSDEIKNEAATRIINFERIGIGNELKADNFQKIVGIGKSIQNKLYAIGIYNYSQLSKMTDEDMRTISKMIDFFPGRIQRDDWKGQATDLLKNKDQKEEENV